jgi:hypothetical protein
MKSTHKTVVIALVMAAIAATAAFAYGGGGFFEGSQYIYPGYTNVENPADVHGGFGYGASRSGSRYGGFGLSISDPETGEFLGGFGGVITGRQTRMGPFTLSANIYAGVGYATPELVNWPGGVSFLAEGTVEAGFAILPWLQISAYGGYQVIGPLDVNRALVDSRYVPVIGTRVTWGSF